MHVVVTGGNGFVMSATVRRLLQACTTTRVTVFDRWQPQELVAERLREFADRVTFVRADVSDPSSLADVDATHVVHGATVVWSPELEAANARSYLDVNVGGTVNMLEWALERQVERFVHVSSGDSYGRQTRWSPIETQDEDGPFDPPELYAISKYASEQVARRYGEIFPLDVRAVRLAGIFGVMERPTPSRRYMSLSYRAVRASIERRPLRITRRALDAGCDYISSDDVARAILALLQSEHLENWIFNVASGVRTPVPRLLEILSDLLPGFEWRVDDASPEFDLDPAERLARFNAYSIARIQAETDWAPHPLSDELRAYISWVHEAPDERCPPSDYGRPTATPTEGMPLTHGT
jgi:nucleoside-diphosphate-sugar epimerase